MTATDEIARLREILSSAQRERDHHHLEAIKLSRLEATASARAGRLATRIESAICMLVEGPDAIGGLEARECAIRILRGLDKVTEGMEP